MTARADYLMRMRKANVLAQELADRAVLGVKVVEVRVLLDDRIIKTTTKVLVTGPVRSEAR